MRILVREEAAYRKKLSQPERKSYMNMKRLSSKLFAQVEDKFREVTSSKFFKQLEALNNYYS